MGNRVEIKFSSEILSGSREIIRRIVRRYERYLPADAELELSVSTALSEESFTISEAVGKTQIRGGSLRAAIYGLGRLLRQKDFRGEDSPEKPERGIYFATHFGNFYDRAAPQELADYIADLALWGCNLVSVWFDMHDYCGVNDPQAVKQIAKLKNILRSAQALGLHTNLMSIGNESFADSPAALRADYHGGKNNYRSDLSGHYHVEICPSIPRGLELILAQREAVWRVFADIPVDSVTIFPYDQGGCTCSQCAPWGANGLLKIIPGYVDLTKRYFPNCEVELSAWRFDSFTTGEWDALFARTDLARWINRVYIDPVDLPRIASGTPGDLPVICMSEISMAGMLPWGGFGANPRLKVLAAELAHAGDKVGFRPYSEGIYEDLNKILILAWGWRARPLIDIVTEYGEFYFGSGNGRRVAEAVAQLSENLEHATRFTQGDVRCSPYSLEKLNPRQSYEQKYETPNLSPARARQALQLLEKIPVPDKSAWRWRLLYIRAVIDVKLSRGEAIDTELTELYNLYHATGQTMPCLVPPGREIIRKIVIAGIDQHI